MKYQYTYGPVPSRRLGLSLGLDVVPFKTCTYNCVYCQLKKTTNQTMERRSLCEPTEVLRELEERVRTRRDLDYITMSGSGEPTLNSDLDHIIEGIRALTSTPVAVLTNSSLLWAPEVREALGKADLVVPSLDAGSEALFREINRPVEGLEFNVMIEGLRTFTHQTKSSVWVEVMLVRDINDSPEHVARLHEILRSLRIDKVQLNTVIRPPNDPLAKPVTPEVMERVRRTLGADLPVEIIASFRREASPTRPENVKEAVLDVLRRRPCRVREMSQSLGIPEEEIVRCVEELAQQAVVERTGSSEEGQFYTLAPEPENSR